MFIGNTYIIPASIPRSGGGGSSFILDIIPGAKDGLLVGYSLRRLTIDYTGPCCTVGRNDGAGPNLDINFDSTGYIDIQPAIDLATDPVYGATSGVQILTWYDQSGNGINLTGTPPSSLALVFGGTGLPFEYDGKYYLSEGSARTLSTSFNIPSASDFTVFTTQFYGNSSGTRNNIQIQDAGFTNYIFGKIDSGDNSNASGENSAGLYNVSSSGPSMTRQIFNLQTTIVEANRGSIELEDSSGLLATESGGVFLLESSDMDITEFVNNTSAGSNNVSGTLGPLTELFYPYSGGQDDNDPTELLIYTENKSSIRSDIDSNIVNFYNLP